MASIFKSDHFEFDVKEGGTYDDCRERATATAINDSTSHENSRMCPFGIVFISVYMYIGIYLFQCKPYL